MTEEEMAIVAKDANRHQKIIWDLQAENEALKALNAELLMELENALSELESIQKHNVAPSEAYLADVLCHIDAVITKAKGVQS